MQAVFLDKDGTLVENIPYNIDPGLYQLLPGVSEGLRALYQAGFGLIIVSNQSGVARGYFSEADLIPTWKWLDEMFIKSDAHLLDIRCCPHHPEGHVPEYAMECICRKPKPGMLIQAAQIHEIDLSRSWMIGDILDDVEAGHRAGCRSILLDTGNETEWKTGLDREPDYIAHQFSEAVHVILDSANIDLDSQAKASDWKGNAYGYKYK